MTSGDPNNPVFTKPSEPSRIFLFDSGGTSCSEWESFSDDAESDPNPTTRVFEDNSLFEEYISKPRRGTRVVYASGWLSCVSFAANRYVSFVSSSLCSRTSVLPLQISESAFSRLQQTYGTGIELSDLADCFGRKPQNAHAGNGGMTVREKMNGIHGMTNYLKLQTGRTKLTIQTWRIYFRIQKKPKPRGPYGKSPSSTATIPPATTIYGYFSILNSSQKRNGRLNYISPKATTSSVPDLLGKP